MTGNDDKRTTVDPSGFRYSDQNSPRLPTTSTEPTGSNPTDNDLSTTTGNDDTDEPGAPAGNPTRATTPVGTSATTGGSNDTNTGPRPAVDPSPPPVPTGEGADRSGSPTGPANTPATTTGTYRAGTNGTSTPTKATTNNGNNTTRPQRLFMLRPPTPRRASTLAHRPYERHQATGKNNPHNTTDTHPR
ncbi:MAG: hypothetical protein AAB131_21920 [Actinomycetota bacterium]